MKSKAYKAVWYIARIALMAVMLGAGVVAAIVMRGIPMVGVGCVITAVVIDLIYNFDTRRREREGDAENDSTRNEP